MMKHKQMMIGALFVCLLGPQTISAQQTPTTSPDNIEQRLQEALQPQYNSTLSLSLAEAQQYAIRQNRSLQNASLAIKEARAQRWQTIASMLPSLDASGTYTDYLGYSATMSMMGSEVKITMPNVAAFNLTAGVGVNGQGVIGVLLNDIAIEMQDINREKTEDELRASVTKTYMSALVLEDIVQLMDSSLKNVQKLASQTQTMADVGAVEQTQADQLHVRANQLRNNLSANERNLQMAYNTLAVLLDINAETQLHLTSTLDQILNADEVLATLLSPFQPDNNHDYRLLEKNVELAHKNVDMAAWAYGPTLSLAYQYTYQHYFQEGGMRMTPPNLLQVTLKVPIFSSGKRAAAVVEKRLALQEAQNTLDETKDNLSILYRNLRYTLANAYETYMTEKENIDVTQRVFAQTTNKYNWGAASSLELTNASNDLITAQSTYVNAVLNLVNAQVELDNFLNNK
ncbi:MAG: TolC family protein [Paludibacteraceae bacterium]|nr:TolC family protein [Paludibacteraceae bacterium]